MESVPIERRARPPGFAQEGPGFYVWDEDEREVLAWARELGGDAAVLECVAAGAGVPAAARGGRG